MISIRYLAVIQLIIYIRNRKVGESKNINENYIFSDFASLFFYVVNIVFQPARSSGSFGYETFVKWLKNIPFRGGVSFTF